METPLYCPLRTLKTETKREHIYHAAMVDPQTRAALSLNQIRSLVDEILLAHGDIIPIGLRKAQ